MTASATGRKKQQFYLLNNDSFAASQGPFQATGYEQTRPFAASK